MQVVRFLEWLSPPVRDDDKGRITRLLNVIIWTFAIIDSCYLLLSFLLRDAIANIAIALGLLGLMICLHYAVKKGWLRLASTLLVIGVWAVFFPSVFTGSKIGIEDPLYSGFIIPVLMAGFLLSTRASLLIAGMSGVVGLIAIIWLAPQPTNYPFSNTLLDWVLYSAFFVIGAVLLHLANRSIRDALERARAGEARLVERNAELQRQIDERKRVEEALHQKNARFKLAMKAARMRTWDWDFQSDRLIFPDSPAPLWNPPIETYQDFLQGLPPEDREAVEKAIERTLNVDAPYVVEHRTPLSDGTIGWVEALGRLYRDETGKPIGLVGISKDITERKRAEDSLRKREESARDFQQRLKALQEVSITLGQCGSLDDLYRLAVELGRQRLDFDRLAIFLYEADTQMMTGTFGTDPNRQTRDERFLRVRVEQVWIADTLKNKDRLSYRLDAPLYDGDVIIGRGWNVMAPIWNGDTMIAWIALDNLTRQESLTDDLIELIALYASTLGHLIVQKKAEHAIRQYDERLTLALKASQMRTWDWNLLTGEISARDFRSFDWSHVTNYEQFLKQVHPEDRDSIKQANDRAAVDHQPYTAEYRIILPDGSFRWIHSMGVPYPDRTGKIVGMVGVSQDITERREAEDALRRSEERFEKAFQANPSAIAISTLVEEERFLAVNDSWVRLFGYTPEETIGRSSRELDLWILDDDTREQYSRTLQETGSIRDIEIIGRTKSGEQVYVLALAEKIELGGESYYLTMLQDITQRKEAEKQALELTLQKERIAMLTEFMGNITHDLKTPLSIINTSTYLAERLTDPEKRHEKFTQIKRQVAALEKFIQDILTILRLDYAPTLQNQPVDLNATVTDVVSRLRSMADQKQVMLSLQLDANGTMLNGDPQEIDRAMMNLVENAVNYTLGGGSVQVHTYQKSSSLLVEVVDTGIGINEESVPRIFERFFRTDEARSAHHGGSGLGLAIVKKIVEMHGGQVEVQSKMGVGTTFRVCFPIPSQS